MTNKGWTAVWLLWLLLACAVMCACFGAPTLLTGALSGIAFVYASFMCFVAGEQ